MPLARTTLFTRDVSRQLLNTFADPYFRQQLTPEQILAPQVLLQEEAIWTLVAAPVSGAATHREDDQILGTAASAKAEYLVTGDKRLQQLGAYRGVHVISPRKSLDVLQVPDDEQ